MEVTAKKILEINSALSRMQIVCPMRFRDARKLNELKKLFSARSAVIAEMEKNLIDNNGGSADERGSVNFKDVQSKEKFVRERDAMLADTDDIEYEPINLSAYIDFIEVPVEVVDTLEEVIIFEDNTTEGEA